MSRQKSDALAQAWKTKENHLRRISLTEQRRFQATPDNIFPLLCPTTELDWLPGWDCELMHTKSGYSEFNCIFKTGFMGFDELFICTRYEKNHAIDYLRISEHACGKLEIKLIDHCDGTTTTIWLIILSALDENGNDMLKHISETSDLFDNVLDSLEYYLKYGDMINETTKAGNDKVHSEL